MTAICLIDTSIFMEILNVPMKANRHADTLRNLKKRVQQGETLFLPMATIFETGNHIGQNGDGRERRLCAERFKAQVNDALEGVAPFKPINFPDMNHIHSWLSEFPDWAAQGSGLGDLSIQHDWQRICNQNSGQRVYIWSFDNHLSAYDRAATL